jgi:uncharacterized SAM-binding protein YcdF (DUF218 family)
MFFLLSKILKFLTSPFIWVVIGLLFFIFSRNRKWKKISLVFSLVILFFFSNPFIADQVVRIWEVQPYDAAKISKPYDVGVLLGGSLLGYDVINNRPVYSQSVDRLLQAIALYNSGKIKKILLSGGSGRVTNPEEREADVISAVLISAGIPKEDILMERKSRNTYENAVYTKEILDAQMPGASTLLITSAFHMRRSEACFKKAGLNTVVYPVDPKSHVQLYTPDALIIPNVYSISLWEMLFHEWTGIIMYKFAGYI